MARFDPLFKTLAQRQGFRTYLSGLLLPCDRSKTLTALAGAEPLVQAQAAEVPRLQFFLSEASWEAETDWSDDACRVDCGSASEKTLPPIWPN